MNIITSKQFDLPFINELFEVIVSVKEKYISNYRLGGLTLASLFYEPSTRTRLSFEAAMYRLGGNVISTENATQFSSAIKGESLEDTIKVISEYADIIVLRHPENNSSERASLVSKVPLINAGSGSGEHPTQALLDIYTIYDKKKKIDGLSIALVGDIHNSRTIHSLLYLLSLYQDLKITLIGLETLPKDVSSFLDGKLEYDYANNLSDLNLGEFDVFYFTRLQKERKIEMVDWKPVTKEWNDCCSLKINMLQQMKDDAIIMHPLPRNEEIPKEVDNDPRSCYFEQAKNGIYVRSSLLYMILK